MNRERVSRWDGNLSYTRPGAEVLRQLNTMKERSDPEDRKLPARSVCERGTRNMINL